MKKKILILENDRAVPEQVEALCKELKLSYISADKLIHADAIDKNVLLDKVIDKDLTDLISKTVYSGSSKQQLGSIIRALYHSDRENLNIHSLSTDYLVDSLNDIDNGDQLRKAIKVVSTNNVVEYGALYYCSVLFNLKTAKFEHGPRKEYKSKGSDLIY